MQDDGSFSIERETSGTESVLTVRLSLNSSGSVSPSIVDLVCKDAKELSVFLKRRRCKEAGVPFGSAAAATLSYREIRFRGGEAIEALRKLILAKKLLWRGKSLFFNPLAKGEVCFEAERGNDGSLLVTPFLSLDGLLRPFSSVEFLFPNGDRSWGICDRVVFFFREETSPDQLDLAERGGALFAGREADRFIARYKEDPPPGFPKVVWKGEYAVPAEVPIPVFPLLVLTDPHGAFARLRMDYEGKVIDFTDPQSFPGRDLPSERGWEKDLLETDFRKRPALDSDYYCPTDKVGKSLSFLLEIGWKIFDFRGKRLVQTTRQDLSLSLLGDRIVLRGTFSYGTHTASVEEIAGAFNRREKFLDLSGGEVALLGQEGVYLEPKELSPSEIVSGGYAVPRKRFGVFSDWEGVHQEPSVRSLLKETPPEEIVEEGEFTGVLRPYQKQGRDWLRFLRSRGFSGLLADEMGLGKTVQTLSFLAGIGRGRPILLVVPTSLVFNWTNEWERFIPGKKLHVHAGPDRGGVEVLKDQDAIITSYAYLRIDRERFASLPYSCIVVDEAQSIKNPDGALARAAFSLQGDMKICLTGTPIENKAEDLWSIFRFLDPELLGTKEDFLSALSSASLDGRYGEMIRKTVKPFILRRKKEEVLQDLPEKIEEIVRVEMGDEQRALYEDFLAKSRRGLLLKIERDGAASHRMEIFEAILRLRQICCDPSLVRSDFTCPSAKLERVLSDLAEVVSQTRKVVVYSQFTSMLKKIEVAVKERGYRYVSLDGSTKNREEVVSSFQNDPAVSVFLISLKAGGVGLNLTAADYVFLFDPWWNDPVENQAIDRAHRLGRKNAVIARRYICAPGIEEKMMKLKEHKAAVAEDLLAFDSAGSESILGVAVDLLR